MAIAKHVAAGPAMIALAMGALAMIAVAGPAAAAQPVVSQPNPSDAVRPWLGDPATEPALAPDALLAALRAHVKHVFILFQENRSFDSYFGSFPGARNLFSQPPEATPGYVQEIVDTDGSKGTIRPFRIGPAQHAADTDDVDHSYPREALKMHVVDGIARMDQYVVQEELKYTPSGGNPPLKAKQYGELTMAYEDCDTIPFLWDYASRFVLFDDFFQHTIGPSTPNALAMIAGQTGETQWVKHPEEAGNAEAMAARHQGEPVTGDPDPFWGAAADPGPDRQPINPRDHADHFQINQTYASLPLTFNGKDIRQITGFDRMAATDLADVQQDIPAIAALQARALPWGWYEEGYDTEPGAQGASHAGYIGHHNGPQYFGYVSNNPKETAHLHGLGDFFADMAGHALPESGGVYYVRGGYLNIAGLKPQAPSPQAQKNFQGDDDHPGYSDAQISEALIAREVNAIARSPYWASSAIIITYDESEGDYDHVPPRILEYGPDGLPLVRGPRIPLIVISPFARAHAVSHETGDHNMIIRFLDRLYGLPYLADLPDEAQARAEGKRRLGQDHLGPLDDGLDDEGDLGSAFDPRRLTGAAPPLPAGYAEIADAVVASLPHYGNQGCKAIGIVPDDVAKGIANPIPADFNPRPSTDPTPAAP